MTGVGPVDCAATSFTLSEKNDGILLIENNVVHNVMLCCATGSTGTSNSPLLTRILLVINQLALGSYVVTTDINIETWLAYRGSVTLCL